MDKTADNRLIPIIGRLAVHPWEAEPPDTLLPPCLISSPRGLGARLLLCLCFLPARRYASAGNSDRNVSVCLSVRHAPVLCQKEES